MKKPMLAGTLKNLSDVKYPCYVTPKIDGIRCLIHEGQAVSRTWKPIRNKFIQSKLAGLPDGLDGELTLRENASFQAVSSAIMRTDGEPDFVYLIFDRIIPLMDYTERVYHLTRLDLPSFCRVLEPEKVADETYLLHCEKEFLLQGYEGVMIRSGDGQYKFGRSTVREGGLLKLKRFEDSEAEVYDFKEQMHNANEAKKDAFGRTERSSHKDGLVPKGTLGALLVRDVKTGVEFEVGTGFDAQTRQLIWDNQAEYLDRIMKYKYQPTGVLDKPRFPVFLGFRDKDDM